MGALTDELLQLEREGWRALSRSGEAAGRFYAEHLAVDVLMLLPGGMVLDDRDQVIETMGGSPWSSFELSDERVLELGNSARKAPGVWPSTSRLRSESQSVGWDQVGRLAELVRELPVSV